MRKSTALRYYDQNFAALGRAIGVTRMTVHNWPDVIPLEPARAIEIVTNGRVTVDERLYPRLRLARRLLEQARRKAVRARVDAEQRVASLG